ncbi:hypothetical protein Gohar_005378 [Gossypium harknessii]|uniref:Uncharacterized protein n=1 Tax=Gossypium harknessii TaxID=34285 RepID=A0A7J9H7V3_9ROSI|nr:hypothetical protein [Gossypium harknessii]
MGSGILGRAVFQAYRQALANASKSGVAQETMQNIRRGSKIMAEPEARQILGVTEHSSWEEVLKKYDNLFEQNAKNGSFYLQSKQYVKPNMVMGYDERAPLFPTLHLLLYVGVGDGPCLVGRKAFGEHLVVVACRQIRTD